LAALDRQKLDGRHVFALFYVESNLLAYFRAEETDYFEKCFLGLQRGSLPNIGVRQLACSLGWFL